MKTLLQHLRTISRAALLFVLSASAFAQTPNPQNAVGLAQFVTGTVEVVRGAQTNTIMKPDFVFEGDLVRTAANSTVQLAMKDGAFISVRPNSEMRIQKYEYEQATPTLGSAVLELLRGTMRTFTGELVNTNRDKFQMKTPVATLGIRGSGNVLSHTQDQGTYNHTLTGAHSVTSKDTAGVDRTLVSLPGQTIQVLAGQAPRFVPTPAFILAAATPPTKQAAGDSEKTSDGTQTAPVAEAAPVSTTATATATTTNAATAASQAATTAQVAAVSTVQLPATQSFFFSARASRPLGSGFEGVFPQGNIAGSSIQLNAAGAVTRVSGVTFATFLTSPGLAAFPANYSPINLDNATVAFSGGTFRDGFRSTDGSVIIGRWEGGSIAVTASGQSSATDYALGPRSAAYQLFSATPFGTIGSFTGTSNYTLAAATAPTDTAGRSGQLTSASVAVNFTAMTAALSAALNINNQNFALAGNTAFSADQGNIAWVRRGNAATSLTVACTGSGCVNNGYEGVVNGRIAGAAGDWMSLDYRLTPNRTDGGAYSDHISGVAALRAATVPTAGIVLPQTGSSTLSFANFQDAGSSFGGAATIRGTMSTNFSTRVASINATIGATGAPTFTATSSNVPIVGVGFSASTTPAAGIGTLAVTCTAGCATASTTFGRFDGYFTNSAGTAGQVAVNVGNASGSYVGRAALVSTNSPTAAPVGKIGVLADVQGPSARSLGITTSAPISVRSHRQMLFDAQSR
jgi:hypothetical protein